MQAIDALLPEIDGLTWFNRLYLDVTKAVAARVAAREFQDPLWIADLDVRFAALYFSALSRWLAGASAPECWRALFERRSDAAIARIQFALAGVNAHINHDLAEAIVLTCVEAGGEPSHGSAHYADYVALNPTLDALIETAKRELLVRLPGIPLPAATHIEDTIAAWNIGAAREIAWTNAEVLWRLRGEKPLAQRYLDALDGTATLAGKALLVPTPIAAGAGA